MTPKWWSMLTTTVVVAISLTTVRIEGYSPVPQGFPVRWDGDLFNNSLCDVVQPPPSWMSGYLFCQLSASYGNHEAPDGQRAEHMFDAISALGVFNIEPQQHSTFTGSYYPTLGFKIWDFEDRDFAKSYYAFDSFDTVVNNTAKQIWSAIQSDAMRDSPNIDFWKINNSIVAGTEVYALGLTFDVQTVSNFRPYQFHENNSLLNGLQLVTYNMPIHERVDPDTGFIWDTVLAANPAVSPPTLHQLVFSVNASGVRTVQGIYNYPAYDSNACNSDYTYRGDRSRMPRYMHSVTSTVNYFILPMTSAYFDPCKARTPTCNTSLCDPKTRFIYPYDASVPLSFLIFDKRNRTFLPVINAPFSHFVSHQFNAYEENDMHLIVDLIGYDGDAYAQLRMHNLLQTVDRLAPPYSRVQRFRINLENRTVTNQTLYPNSPPLVEFSQINRNYEGKRYRYGYAVVMPFFTGSQIVKMDMDNPNGTGNVFFTAGDSISLSEPSFVQAPGSSGEDEGLLVFRGLDTSANTTRVYVVDAKTMQKVGELRAPTLLPFGLHERFYTKTSLGIQVGRDPVPQNQQIYNTNAPNNYNTHGDGVRVFSSNWVMIATVVLTIILHVSHH